MPTRLLPRLGPTLLLQPGLRLFGVLSMRAKLALVAACVLLPLGGLSAWSARQAWQGLQDVQAQREGLAVHAAVHALSLEVQKHHGLNERVRAGDSTAAGQRADVARALEQAGQAAAQAVAAHAVLAESWAGVAERLRPLGPDAGSAAHADALQRLTQLAHLNAEHARLTLLTDPAGHARVQALVETLPPLFEVVTRAVADGSAALAGGGGQAMAADARLPLLALATRVDLALKLAGESTRKLERTGAALPAGWAPAHKATDAFATLLHEAFAPERPELPAAALHAAGMESVAQLEQLHAELNALQARDLDERLDRQRRTLALGAAAVAGAFALVLYALACLQRSFTASLQALQQQTQAVSNGDLSTQLELTGNDEMAAIGRSVNGMSQRLSSLVSEIRSSATRVNMAGTQVAEGSQRLSQRTEEQAGRLRESVQAISALSDAVSENARGARELDTLTEQLARQATEGHRAMGETITSVAQLQEASRRVFEVVAVIDDVAFQTSMLSLNAAVEAARAGEAGRGFALVASEVRSLAQRVGDSADEIRALITQASDRLEFSGTQLGSANGALDGVVRGVHDVSARLRQIAQASTEQSEQLVAVAQGVGDLDQITRDNARLVDESTFASQALLERAQVLREAVAPMKLRQGSADEAHELLDRAWSHVMQIGNEQGLKDLHDPDLGFIDRDLYVFALDRAGTYIACGAKPGMVGTNVNELPGIRGTPFVQQAWAAAESGGGWVQYEVANPLTGEVTPKESYVRQLDDGLLLGCGVYRHVAPVAAGTRPRAAAWSRRQEAAGAVAA